MTKLFEPSISTRFLATFLFHGVPSPLDLRFQRVTGLSREMSVTSRRQGGDNVGTQHFPQKIQHGSLVLERALMTVTPLTAMFTHVMNEFDCLYLDVIIMLLNDHMIPVCGWTIIDALPCKWQTSELNAQKGSIVINTLELQYRSMHTMGVRA